MKLPRREAFKVVAQVVAQFIPEVHARRHGDGVAFRVDHHRCFEENTESQVLFVVRIEDSKKIRVNRSGFAVEVKDGELATYANLVASIAALDSALQSAFFDIEILP